MIKPSECPRPHGLIECNRVLDIGAGIRPMGWYEPRTHMCIEPHRPYAEQLWLAGYNAICDHALHALRFVHPGDYEAIYMLDMIEHLDREHGKQLLQAVYHLHPKQIVVFTPYGFLPQSGDAWDMGGDFWQEHRSGWMPKDFPGWDIQMSEPPLHASFHAVWTRP
jgi:hypothetical protein